MSSVDHINIFALKGAREVLDISGGSARIKQTIDALEQAVEQSPPLALDLAKSLIETVCKTILTDKCITIDSKWTLQQLFSTTIKQIRLVPVGHTQFRESTDSLQKMMGGLLTTIQGLSELRNNEGLAGHGQDAFETMLESMQAEFVAKVADSICCIIYKAHKQYPEVKHGNRFQYSDFPEFNNHIDDLHGELTIFDIPYLTSEVLFKVDINAYREQLTLYSSTDKEDESSDE